MPRRTQSRDNVKVGAGPGSLRSAGTFGTFGTFERVNEVDYPVRRRDFAAGPSDNSSAYGGYARSTTSSHASHVQHLPPLPGSVTGGGFLALDDMVESRSGSFTTAMSGRGGGGGRPVLNSGRASASEGAGRSGYRDFDFDELDVIDDAEP
jgi:hypothetical protein